MSLLVRAALLGGLAYVVSRAVRKSDGSNFLNRSEAGRINQSMADRIARDSDPDSDIGWQTSDQPSTSNA